MKEREAKVLKHVVMDYVETCEPVGSRRISERLGVSPATVRNDMRTLFEEGYLEQPHTSAGRIPGDTGYRFFVDYLLEEYREAEAEGRAVQSSLELIRVKLEQLFSRVSGLLASLAECVSFVAVPEDDMSRIGRIELTPVSGHGLLIIVVMSSGLIENKLVELQAPVDRLPLKWISRVLNERLSGLRLRDITPAVLGSVFRDVKVREEVLYGSMIRFFEDLIYAVGRRVYFDGAARLARYPEFKDGERLGQVLEVIESTDSDSELFEPPRDAGDVKVVIGHENTMGELHECSVIKSRFSFGDLTLGTVGLVGPRRMNYARMIWLVHGVADALSGVLGKYPRP